MKMKKIVNIGLIIAGLVYFSGCGSSSRDFNATIGSSSSRDMGSLSGEESEVLVLNGKSFSKIDIDLDKYKFNQDSGMKSYKIDMSFGKKRVEGIADCNRFSANYKLKDSELSFSKIHFELATNLATCEGYLDADEAVNAFLSSTYSVDGFDEYRIILNDNELDTSVILTK